VSSFRWALYKDLINLKCAQGGATFNEMYQKYDRDHYPTHTACLSFRLPAEQQPTEKEIRTGREDILQGDKKKKLNPRDVPSKYAISNEVFGGVELKERRGGWCRLPVSVVWKAAEIIIAEAPSTANISQQYLKAEVGIFLLCSFNTGDISLHHLLRQLLSWSGSVDHELERCDMHNAVSAHCQCFSEVAVLS
jgi:hypothetical protein